MRAIPLFLLHRSALGLAVDRAFISAKVVITINARAQMGETFRAN
jgi:hypothetical protein